MTWLWDPRYPRRNLWAALALVALTASQLEWAVGRLFAGRQWPYEWHRLLLVLYLLGVGVWQFHRALERAVPAERPPEPVRQRPAAPDALAG